MSIKPNPKDEVPKFRLGTIVATSNAIQAISPDEIWEAILRHAYGDWGDVGEEDWQANEEALQVQSRLLSVYHTAAGVKFYLITEHDRSVTTVLLPDDY